MDTDLGEPVSAVLARLMSIGVTGLGGWMVHAFETDTGHWRMGLAMLSVGSVTTLALGFNCMRPRIADALREPGYRQNDVIDRLQYQLSEARAAVDAALLRQSRNADADGDGEVRIVVSEGELDPGHALT